MTHDDPATTRPPGFWRGPFARRTWAESLFLLVGVVVAPVGLGYALLTIALGAGLAVTVVGLAGAGVLVVGGRAWGGLYRGLGRGLLGVDVPAPAPFRLGRGFWQATGSLLGDVPGWRALAFLVLSFVTIVGGFVVSGTVLAVALGAITYPLWYRYLPEQVAADGSLHRGAQYAPDWFVDTPARIGLQLAAGIVLLLLWPVLQRGLVHLTRLLVVHLLGPTRAGARVAELERSRGRTVEDADDRLRRIERDLHDGTQARLVAVAMQLGEAKELLASDDPAVSAEARALVGQAHTSTKEALTELREIARGIRPPALDAGLADALATLGARSPVRTVVDVAPGASAAPAVEALAYFAVSELVTNAAKHAHASTVSVLVEPQEAAGRSSLRVRVRDDGRGGAHVDLADPRPGHGTGLAGLVERVQAVDGTLTLRSPHGEGTCVDIVLPVTLPTGTEPSSARTAPRPADDRTEAAGARADR